MTDPLDQALSDLDRQLGIEPGTDETAAADDGAPEGGAPAAEPQDDRLRDELGRFAKADEPETPAAEPLDDKFAGYLTRVGIDPSTYGETPEQFQKALRAGYEADSLVGRKGQENDQLRRQLEEAQQAWEQYQQPQQQPQQQQYDADQVAAYFDQNPAAIVPTIQQAWANNDRQLVYMGIAALEDAGDRVTAESLRIRIATLDAQAELAPQLQPMRERAEQDHMQSAWQQAVGQHPEMANYTRQILEAAEQNPAVVARIQDGSVESARDTLISLYKIAAFDNGLQTASLVNNAASQAAADTAAQAAADKQAAFVGSAATRTDPETLSEGEAWAREFLDPYIDRTVAARDL